MAISLGLEASGFLNRKVSLEDRRAERLSLTKSGKNIFSKLGRRALEYDREMRDQLGSEVTDKFIFVLKSLVSRQIKR